MHGTDFNDHATLFVFEDTVPFSSRHAGNIQKLSSVDHVVIYAQKKTCQRITSAINFRVVSCITVAPGNAYAVGIYLVANRAFVFPERCCQFWTRQKRMSRSAVMQSKARQWSTVTISTRVACRVTAAGSGTAAAAVRMIQMMLPVTACAVQDSTSCGRGGRYRGRRRGRCKVIAVRIGHWCRKTRRQMLVPTVRVKIFGVAAGVSIPVCIAVRVLLLLLLPGTRYRAIVMRASSLQRWRRWAERLFRICRETITIICSTASCIFLVVRWRHRCRSCQGMMRTRHCVV